MTTIALNDYNIYVGDAWEAIQNYIGEHTYSQYFILVDENTKEHCLPIFLEKMAIQNYQILEILSGELHKNIDTCQYIWQRMMDLGADRHALTINLGGGVIGDMGGFCASTYMRGMDFIQIPTTLLSQVDASIGGKLGIDFGQLKNSVGLFKNPKAVFVCPEFFNTLSKRELRSGFAEIIKHALIADLNQWQNIQQLNKLDDINWEPFLVPSLNIKKQIVTADPFEKGIRKALNFGHTIGHAIESVALTSDKPLLHGEAIAIGMISEAYLSHKVLDMPLTDLSTITNFILKIYGKVTLDQSNDQQYLYLMSRDKKNERKQINFTMLKTAGEALINQHCSEALILESIDYYRGL